MSDWRKVVVSPDLPLRNAIERIDKTSLQVALVLDQRGALLGVLTDGDVRRAILKEQSLDIPTGLVMNAHATSAPLGTAREEMLAIMRRHTFHHLPLVDENGLVAGLVTLDELIGATRKSNWVVLMAGGLGTRLHPLTKEKPKPLLHVGGKPILETIMEAFIEQGFHRFYMSVNYKAEMIQEHFGDGGRWGVHIDYLQESMRLGTAGALSLLPERTAQPLIVMNGDLLTRVNFDNLLEFHREHASQATMAIREYEHQVPYGVVRLNGANITSIEEKPTQRHFVSAGIYVLSPGTLDCIPPRCFFDMPSLFERLIADGRKTAAYPLREYWLDIGRMEELEQAQRDWQNSSP